MAVILQYRRPAEAEPRQMQPYEGALGQVVIFPGVRIDRFTEDDSPRENVSAARKGAARSRKKQRR
jgi:hypothetical protein